MELVYLFTVSPGTHLEKKYYFDTDTLLGNDKQVSVSVSPVGKHSETYHPARITYTGITIGGIHTGSVNIQNEYYTFKESRTNKGKVMIGGLDPHIIQLSDELLEIAKQDPVIKTHLAGNRLGLRGEGMRVNEQQMLNMLRGNDISGRTQYLNSQADACYPMDFCARVADFIANALDGKYLTEKQRQDAASLLLENNKPETILVGELLAGYSQDKSKELLQQAFDRLLNSDNAELWKLVKNYLAKHHNDESQDVIQEIEQKLSTQIKYEIDGQVFYDKEAYDSYVWKKEWAQREKRDKIKVAVVSTLSCLFIGGVGLLLLIMMGII